MSDATTSCGVLERILDKSGKDFMCPLCWTLYSTSHQVFDHCRQNGKKKDEINDEETRRCEIHQALGAVNMRGDFRKFRESLATACGQTKSGIPVDELPVDWSKPGRRSYGSCLRRKFIMEKMAIPVAGKPKILKVLLDRASIYYACPACWTGFAEAVHVTKHCGTKKDEDHQELLSKDENTFVELYGKLLGRTVDVTHMEVDYDGHGVPDFHRSFRIDKILEHLMPNRLV